jgi:hypothetical protein
MTAWVLVATLPVMSGVPCASPAAAQTRTQQPVPGGPLIPLPDLTVSWVGWHDDTCIGHTRKVSITVTVNNVGPGPAMLPAEWTKPWVTAYLAKPVPGFVQPYATLGKATTLGSGKSLSLEIGMQVPGGGIQEIIVKVDPSNVIKETNEGNNTAKGKVPSC